MTELADRKCVPCKKGGQPLKGDALAALAEELDSGWKIVAQHHIEKLFKFDNFAQALDFVNQVGELAEQQAHHPDIELSWGKAKISLFTHAVDGLSESDFIMAAKIERL